MFFFSFFCGPLFTFFDPYLIPCTAILYIQYLVVETPWRVDVKLFVLVAGCGPRVAAACPGQRKGDGQICKSWPFNFMHVVMISRCFAFFFVSQQNAGLCVARANISHSAPGDDECIKMLRRSRMLKLLQEFCTQLH
jgi:hypothetical protein